MMPFTPHSGLMTLTLNEDRSNRERNLATSGRKISPLKIYWLNSDGAEIIRSYLVNLLTTSDFH
jgi:hypothetical protein